MGKRPRREIGAALDPSVFVQAALPVLGARGWWVVLPEMKRKKGKLRSQCNTPYISQVQEVRSAVWLSPQKEKDDKPAWQTFSRTKNPKLNESNSPLCALADGCAAWPCQGMEQTVPLNGCLSMTSMTLLGRQQPQCSAHRGTHM